MKRSINAKELGVITEAIEWAHFCEAEGLMREDEKNIQTMAEAIEWAINEYKFNLDDEDHVDKDEILQKIDILTKALAMLKEV